MLTQQISDMAASVSVDAVCSLLNGGTLCLFDGHQPEFCGDEMPETLLAALSFGTPAFEPAENGVAMSTAIASDDRAKADGVATWFRAYTSDWRGVMDGSVGIDDANLVLDDVEIQQGARVSVSRFVYTQKKTS